MLEIHKQQRPEPAPSRNRAQSAFSRFQVSLGTAQQERKMLMDIGNWLEDEIQQSQDNLFLQQPHTVSSLLPTISNIVLNKFDNVSWLEDEIRERLRYKSFQYPDKIADAIRLVSDKKLWDEVSMKLSITAKDVKQQLTSIVDRRNKIAHEADIDPTFGIGGRWIINEALVEEAVDFIEKIVETIHEIL